MIIDKLRQSTQQAHKELDSWLMPKFQQINSTDQYSDLLKAFYGYFMPVMKMVDEKLDSASLPDYQQRRKPAAILNDLDALQQSGDDINYATKLPHVSNAAQAFGALYVLEGSTLGGVFLSKILAQQTKLDEKSGLSFFYGYGKESRAKWETFIEHLNAFAAEKNNDEQITGAAVETFQYFKQHLQQNL